MPTVVFEPNAEPGFTNRVLAAHGQRASPRPTKRPTKLWGSKATLTEFPCARNFSRSPPRAPAEPFHILITGGSQGALVINRTLVDAADLLATQKNRISIVHQTGERDYNAVRVAYARREINAEVLPFIGNMAERFAQADLIVCRAGAITAAEVAAAGRAAIFIPFGASTDSHQLRNAQEMQRAGAARLIPEPQLTAERLTQEIFSLLDQPAELQAMAANARRLAKPHAVAGYCESDRKVRSERRSAHSRKMMVTFHNFKRIHLVGIGGIGMSGIAEVLLTLGYSVSGFGHEDCPRSPTACRIWARKFSRATKPSRFTARTSWSFPPPCARDNPEVVEAHRHKIPVIPRAEMLARIDAPEIWNRHRRRARQDHHDFDDRIACWPPRASIPRSSWAAA